MGRLLVGNLLRWLVLVGAAFVLWLLAGQAQAATCVATFNGKDNSTGVVYQALRLDSGASVTDCAYLVVSGPEWSAVAATSPDYAALGITPAVILQVFGWGFASVIFFWSLGLGLGMATSTIRKV